MKNISRIKSLVIWFAKILLLPFVGFFGYLYTANHLAQSRAENICQSISIGMSMAEARDLVFHADADPQLKYEIDNQYLSVGFHGAFLDRWTCNVSVNAGKVVSREVRLLD